MEVGPLSAAEIRTGTITLGGSLTVLQQNAALTSAATPRALISGNLSPGPTGTRTIVANDGAAADDLVITATITGGAGGTPGLTEGFIDNTGSIDPAGNPGTIATRTPRPSGRSPPAPARTCSPPPTSSGRARRAARSSG